MKVFSAIMLYAERRYAECHDYLNVTLSVIMLSIVTGNVVCTECHYTECRFAECRCTDGNDRTRPGDLQV